MQFFMWLESARRLHVIPFLFVEWASSPSGHLFNFIVHCSKLFPDIYPIQLSNQPIGAFDYDSDKNCSALMASGGRPTAYFISLQGQSHYAHVEVTLGCALPNKHALGRP